MPVLPLVGSTITERRSSILPSASAASIIATPIRSLTDPPGLKYSSFTQTSARRPAASRCSATSGVPPTVADASGLIFRVGALPAIGPRYRYPAPSPAGGLPPREQAPAQQQSKTGVEKLSLAPHRNREAGNGQGVAHQNSGGSAAAGRGRRGAARAGPVQPSGPGEARRFLWRRAGQHAEPQGLGHDGAGRCGQRAAGDPLADTPTQWSRADRLALDRRGPGSCR